MAPPSGKWKLRSHFERGSLVTQKRLGDLIARLDSRARSRVRTRGKEAGAVAALPSQASISEANNRLATAHLSCFPPFKTTTAFPPLRSRFPNLSDALFFDIPYGCHG